MGASVGGIIVLTNARSLIRSERIDLPAFASRAIYTVIIAAWIGAFLYSLREYLRDRERESADAISAVAQAASGPEPALP